MSKRKHGVSSVPFNFATIHYAFLSKKKEAGENVSAYIDSAISHYDGPVNWRIRGKDPEEVRIEEVRRSIDVLKRYAHEIEGRTWIEWLELRIHAARLVTEAYCEDEGESE